MKWLCYLFMGAGLLFIPVQAEEAALQDPEAIMQAATVLGKAPDLYMKIVMEIRAGQGSKSRTLEVYYKQAAGETRTLIQITEPSFLRKMKFLTHAYKDGSKAKWLKTSSGTRRLSGADSAENLFDSDFTVEDLSEFDLEQYSLEYLGKETYNSAPCDVIEAVPAAKNGLYGRKRVYVHETSRIVQRVDYLDKNAALVKQYRLVSAQEINGQGFPAECVMETFKDKSATTVLFTVVETDKPIPDKYFNKANL